jgi:hypothetical protein
MVLYGLCALCFFENLWNMCLQPCARVQTVVALRGILGVLILPEPASSCRRCTMGSGCLEISAGWIVSEIMLEFMLQSCWCSTIFIHFFIHFSWCLLIIIYSQLFWLANGASGTEKAAPLAAGLSGTVLDAKLLGNVGMMEDQESWLEHDWKMIGWWNWVVVNASAVSTWIFWRFAVFLMFIRLV